MTALEQKRYEYIKEKHDGDERYSDAKVEFLVRTGLTFDSEKIADKKNKDWYYPKGAGFKNSEPGPEPEDDNTQENIEETINDPENTTTVTTIDDQGNVDTEPLDPNSTIEPVTVDDGDNNPNNDPVIVTSDGEMIVTEG